MRIACILGDGFEDSEFKLPRDRFRDAGHAVTVIGFERGRKLTGMKGKVTVTADLGIDEADPRAFDALFIPGGHSPDLLRGDARFVEFVRAFRDRPIFAICHGPQMLITADLVRGRILTAWKTVQVDLRNAGASVPDREVVVDANLVTSRQPGDLDAFVRASLAHLGAGGEARP
jgi:protease I